MGDEPLRQRRAAGGRLYSLPWRTVIHAARRPEVRLNYPWKLALVRHAETCPSPARRSAFLLTIRKLTGARCSSLPA